MIDPSTSSSPRSHHGFTLIELLTVIGIIAILMGILLPTISSVKQTAKKTQAKTDVAMIVTAIQAYYTDYGRYPLPEALGTKTTDAIFGDGGNYENKLIMDVLRAEDGGKVNTRKKVYFEGQVAKKKGRYGIQTEGSEVGSFLDPWGQEYRIAVDYNYSKSTETYIPKYTNTDVMYVDEGGVDAIRAGAIAYSFGKDGQQGNKGTPTLKGSDDVVSWE